MSESASQPLRHTNLRDQALEVIRQALVSGEIKPGEIYSAAALATRLGVSGSPVREAMLTLVNQGLMEPVRNRGYRVVPMSEHDLDEVYEMRLLLEVHGTLQAAGNMSKGDLARLESTVADMEAAAGKGDVVQVLEADRQFHLGLLTHCGNKRLVNTVETLRDQTRLYGLEYLAQHGTLTDIVHEHRDILSAIADSDMPRLESIIRAHLHHVRSDWADGD
ncbi:MULTISPECIES: GntR family transcriptional regulator [Streptomyces]|uniref:GntR family transcriptional regulator n=1 Tax=Streptomyces TaxID=1883 RepID=UPI0020206947|nr:MULTISPECIES: GntR family transcriptional regulator [Streptomyces]MCL7493654.1 GntR family transcriptional regulator [Streptomyces sp. MCA2]